MIHWGKRRSLNIIIKRVQQHQQTEKHNLQVVPELVSNPFFLNTFLI